MAVAVVVYAAGNSFRLYQIAPQSYANVLVNAMNNPWLTLYERCKDLAFDPIVEELYLRGWLWTGLRKHWTVFPTAVLTGTIWLAMHLDFRRIITLFPVAIILSVARHFGGVRASIFVHVLVTAQVALLDGLEGEDQFFRPLHEGVEDVPALLSGCGENGSDDGEVVGTGLGHESRLRFSAAASSCGHRFQPDCW